MWSSGRAVLKENAVTGPEDHISTGNTYASRLKLADLVPSAVDAFYADQIGVGHALLLAKLPPDQQEQALSACFKEVYNGASKSTRILLPVRNLQFWIDSNILLVLKDAPFNKRDAELVPTAGSCADCPKRTGHNKLLFGDDLGRQGDRCIDPTCYQSKVAAHVAKTIAAKPELVQISTAYGAQKEGSPVLPRNKYTAIRDDKPKSKDEAKQPEFKVCKFTTEAIITEGSEVGILQKVCANPSCPVHHPKQATNRDEEKYKAEQEKQRKEQAIANTTGLRVLAAIGSAVPVRLMKRDLLFILEKLVGTLDESRSEMLGRQHGVRQKRDDGGTGKTHIAIALGLAACQQGHRVRFTTTAALVSELIEARDDKKLLRFQKQIASYELLIVDELGFVPLSKTGAELLFEMLSQRYERGSTLITSNLPFQEWTEILGSERLTGALLDRLTHHVHILEMNGDSYRLKQSRRKRNPPPER